jgi:hypothetical protein
MIEFSVTIQIRDSKSKTGRSTFYIAVPDAVTDKVSAVSALTAELITRLEDLHIGLDAGAAPRLPLVTNTSRLVPDANSDVEERLYIPYRDENGDSGYNLIPCVNESIFIAGTRKVDTTDAAWQSLTALLSDAQAQGFQGYFTNGFGVRIQSVQTGLERFKR